MGGPNDAFLPKAAPRRETLALSRCRGACATSSLAQRLFVHRINHFTRSGRKNRWEESVQQRCHACAHKAGADGKCKAHMSEIAHVRFSQVIPS